MAVLVLYSLLSKCLLHLLIEFQVADSLILFISSACLFYLEFEQAVQPVIHAFRFLSVLILYQL